MSFSPANCAWNRWRTIQKRWRARSIDDIPILRRSRSFVDWNKTGDLAKTLDGLRASIAGPLAAANPCLAAERFFSFFALGRPTIDRVDDSSGRVSSAFRNATEDFATTLAFDFRSGGAIRLRQARL